jgi:uncharacterized integral membrane protein (TIGR00697 family)
MNMRKMDLVVALYIFGVIAAEVFGGKTIKLWGLSWHASAAIFVVPLLFATVDIVVEVYGKARARSMVYCGLIAIFLLVLYAALATSLPPTSRYASTEPAFDKIFQSSIRLSIASLAAFAASELLDVAVFANLRARMNGKALWLRNGLTNFVSQFFDSAVFLSLAFYATGQTFSGNASFIWSLLFPYWILRCLLSIAETPIVYLGVWWLRGSVNPKVKVKEA